jgi:quercetin dioxygenase-like cupin family protein
MELAPNASAPAHGHETGYGLALVTSGRLEEDGGAVEAQSGAGFLRWHEPSEHHALRNAGQDPVQVLEFEILY